MTFKIFYHPLVTKKDIPKLKRLKSQVRSAIENKLAKAPLRFGKPLQYSLKGYRSLRVGELRVVFGLDRKMVFVIKIGHRKEVYDDAVQRVFG